MGKSRFGSPTADALISCLRFDHLEQLIRRVFDIKIAALSSSALGREQAASINDVEVAIGKLVSGLCMFAVTVIDTEMPLPVFFDSIRANEGILFFHRRLVLTPRVPQVHQNTSMLDQFLSTQE
jgi:hypothetical protein